MTQTGHRRPAFAERTNGILVNAYSALAPENLTTLAHFSVSSATSLPKSAGEPASGVPPKSASRALIFGSASPALISLLSLSTISAGAFFGAPPPLPALCLLPSPQPPTPLPCDRPPPRRG